MENFGRDCLDLCDALARILCEDLDLATEERKTSNCVSSFSNDFGRFWDISGRFKQNFGQTQLCISKIWADNCHKRCVYCLCPAAGSHNQLVPDDKHLILSLPKRLNGGGRMIRFSEILCHASRLHNPRLL